MIGKENVKKWRFQLRLSSKNLFHHKEDRVSSLIHGDDFVITGPKKETGGVRQENDKCLSIKSEDHQLWIAEDHQDVEQQIALEKARNCLSVRSQTR